MKLLQCRSYQAGQTCNRLREPSDFTFRFRDLFSCRIAISDYCSLLHACTAAVSCLLSISHQASALTGIFLPNGDYVFVFCHLRGHAGVT